MTLDAINGTVIKTRWRSDESGWTVMTARVDGERDDITVVGALAGDVEGSNFTASGKWTTHAKHGRQFEFQALTPLAPRTADQITRRLVTYPGIGPSTAAKIVAKFGEKTWHVMDTSLSSLGQVSGIGPSALKKIRKHHATQHGPVAKIQHRLLELGGHAWLAMAIHDAFKDRSLEMIEQHPYKVAAKVDRFGWGLAEKIGRAIGLDPESDERVDAGLLHVFGESKARGHCAMPPAEVLKAALRLLRLTEPVIERGVERLLKAKTLVLQLGEVGSADPSLLFLRRMEWTESAVSHSVARLATSDHEVWDVGELPDHLSPGQVEAVQSVARSGFTIITGGPGTGKSTVVANVLALATRLECDVILCAPTGRAAKRMSEATDHDASTIHRLLETNPGTMTFRRDKNNPLPAGLIVIDEASMLDINLAESLFAALTKEHRVLIVGDADQLPSVGPGNVLRDIIEAAEQGTTIPVVRLSQVFRQAAGSTIISNAHRILAGEDLAPDPKSRGAEGEFYVLEVRDADAAHRKIVEMASGRVTSAYGFDRLTEVQVLCPMHKGPAGTEAFNTTLQRLYTKDGDGFGTKNGRRFFLDDRVMQTKNDYNRNVFNGDIGTVIRIDGSGEGLMAVDFDGLIAEYSRKDLGPLRLAYAMSIHKSQGSEFPAVLVPMLMSHSIMLRRNLLYTAITRAKRLCVVVGQPRAIRQAIAAADAAERWTGLTRRVLSVMGHDARGGHLRLASGGE